MGGNTPSSARLLCRSVGLVWRTSWMLTALACGLVCVTALIPAAQAWVLKLLLDDIVRIISPRPHVMWNRHLFGLLLSQVTLMLIGTIASSAMDSAKELLGMRVTQHVQQLMLTKASSVDLVSYEDSAFYDAIENAQSEGTHRPAALVFSLLGIMQQLVAVIAMTALLWRLTPWLVPVIAVASLPRVAVAARFSRRTHELATTRVTRRRLCRYLSQLLMTRDTAHEVRSYGLARPLQQRFRSLADWLFGERFHLETRRLRWEIAASFTSILGFSTAYGLAVWRAIGGSATLGDLAMFFRASDSVRGGLFSLFQQVVQVHTSELFLANLFQFLDAEPGPIESSARPKAEHSTGVRTSRRPPTIEFQDVSFCYPGSDHPALQGISLMLEPGEHMTLVGPNGSGKSTFVKLLLRLYDPTSGRILVDGCDLRDTDIHAWRSLCAVLFQDFACYQLSLADNICVTEPAGMFDGARLHQALSGASLDGIVASLRRGLDTPLGRLFDEGRELSVGEWQRVALARAFYRDSCVVVLDEPTASLDVANEAAMLDAYRKFCKERTAVLISHRLATTRFGDKIAVLDNGALVGWGTPREVLDTCDLYRKLHSIRIENHT